MDTYKGGNISKERSSAIFEIYSAIDGEWYIVEDVLVDSGADLSLLPYRQGKLFILDIESGDEIEIRGIVPYSKLTVYLHCLKFRIDKMEFDAPVAISDLDDFFVEFDRGNEVGFS